MVTEALWVNLTIEQIDSEIQQRRELIQNMVGQLYPSILYGQIERLLELRRNL